MAMTEKQGGSDVRANTTRAVPAGDGSYLLTGHKWFCSAPMCDLFLVLAQADGGPDLLPAPPRAARRQQEPDAHPAAQGQARQPLERLLRGRVRQAVAWPVGEPGRGVATIIEMVSSTRLDCILGSAACIRQACVEATHHASHRSAFGAPLASQPAMTAVLADLALESEAATTLAMRLAAAADLAARGDAGEAALLRLLLPAAKHWICKRTPAVVAEALECLGGNGYVEESVMPRLYRDAPLNSIWEGSGNVTALDLLRALARSPGSIEALRAELSLAAGADPRLDAATQRLWGDAGRDLRRPAHGALPGSRAGRLADPGHAGCAARQVRPAIRQRRLLRVPAGRLARPAPQGLARLLAHSPPDLTWPGSPTGRGPRPAAGPQGPSLPGKVS